MRIKVIAGNWKMHKTIEEAKSLARRLVERVGKPFSQGCVAIFPPFTALTEVRKIIEKSSIRLGAQNLFWEEEGAFTGEISAKMLKDTGCSFVIIGHSERRKYFSETDEAVNKKLKSALSFDLTPIVCVGETLEEREEGCTFKIIEGQIRGAFKGISEDLALRVIIAYEPVWAIGTGKVASPSQAQEVHQFIRELLEKLYSKELAQNILILYGGSVNPENIEGLISQGDIDGALVGGASLKLEAFSLIVEKSIKA